MLHVFVHEKEKKGKEGKNNKKYKEEASSRIKHSLMHCFVSWTESLVHPSMRDAGRLSRFLKMTCSNTRTAK